MIIIVFIFIFIFIFFLLYTGTAIVCQNFSLLSPLSFSTITQKLSLKLLVFVGDIHGQVYKLQSLWENILNAVTRISLAPPKIPISIVFLGDYCDRGKYTRDTFDFLTKLPAKYNSIDFKFLCGNHDQAFAKFIENDKNYSKTWERFVPRKQETLYSGDGFENMHLQGRRWAGQFNGLENDSIYQARATCESYNSPFPDRDSLLTSIPPEHKIFLETIDYVYEYENTDYGRILAVHAGLEDISKIGVESQLQDLKDKNDDHQFNEPLCGRDNVLHMPSSLLDSRTWIVSGHHGYFSVNGRRLIIDECGGKDCNKISAVLFMPSWLGAVVESDNSPPNLEESQTWLMDLVDGDQFSWCDSIDPSVRLLRIRSAF